MKVPTENGSFLRDTHSKALLMKDSKQADDYKLKSRLMRAAKSRDEEINNLKMEVVDINGKLEEITNLLKGLVNK